MKPPRKPTAKKNTHYSWRPSDETRELFEELIEQFPYINKTPFLDVALAYYVEQTLEHGFDIKTLRPRAPQAKRK